MLVSWRRGLVIARLFCWAILFVSASAYGETVFVAPDFPLTPEAITERLERIRADPDLPSDKRDRLASAYEAALADLRAAESLRRKAEAFREAAREAPERFAELRRSPLPEVREANDLERLSLDQLEGLLHEMEARLDRARETLAKIEGEQNKRSRRRVEVPQQISEASQRLSEIDALLRTSGAVAGDDAAAVRQAALLAERERLRATIAAAEAEIASYDARREMLAAKRDRTIRTISRLEEAVSRLREAFAERHRLEAEKTANKAIEMEREAAGLHPVLREIAERNAELAELRSGPDGLAIRLQKTRSELAEVEALLAEVRSRFERTRQKAEAVGFISAIGVLLRKERTDLPDVVERQRALRKRASLVSEVQLRLIELEDERERLADIDARVDAIMAELGSDVSEQEKRRIEKTARELLLSQKSYLESVIEDYDAYFGVLVELDARESELIAAVNEYAEFIDEHVMWIRGPSIFSMRMVQGAAAFATWVSVTSNSELIAEGVVTTLTLRPLRSGALVLLWIVLVLYRRRATRVLAELCPTKAKALSLTMRHTLAALGLVAALAAAWPVALWLVAYLVGGVEGASGEIGAAFAAGLRTTALALFVLDFVRRLCRPKGPAEVHFYWPAKTARAIRRQLALAMPVTLPALFLVAMAAAQSDDLIKTAIGRLAFLVVMVDTAIALHRMLHPASGALEPLIKRARSGLAVGLAQRAHVLAALVPAGLALAAAAGYDFAAQSLAYRLAVTLLWVLLVVLVHALVVRWLLLARRKLALRQAWEKRAERAQAAAKETTDGDAVPVTEPETLDIGAINMQTRRLVRSFLAVSLLIATWLTWHDVLPALRVFERVELWQASSQVTETIQGEAGAEQRTITRPVVITLADALKALIIVLLAFVAGRNLPGLLEMTVLQQLPLDAGLRYAVTSVARYMIGVVGIVLSFGALGVGWSQVQWLVAAMTVGLGFGLQEIFANFVSGLIILFERPVRVGDVVTLGDVSGTVARIRIRATTIVDWDRKELVVPNKEFITGQLVNWTLSDQILRIVVNVGLAYGSDTEKAERLLLEVAGQCEYVLDDPPPTVLFAEFGDSTLDFQLRCFVAKFDHYWRARHVLRMAIDKAFRKEGIEIAFPQRDLHLRSVSEPISVTLRRADERGSR